LNEGCLKFEISKQIATPWVAENGFPYRHRASYVIYNLWVVIIHLKQAFSWLFLEYILLIVLFQE